MKSQLQAPEAKPSNNKVLNTWFAAAVIVWLMSMGSYLVWFYYLNEQPLSTASSDWGTFGDFVGGFVNPLVALFTLNFVIRAYRLQSVELVETREALEATSKEQSLNRQITAQNAIMNADLANLEFIRQRKAAKEAYRLFLCDRGARMQAGYNYDGDKLDGYQISDLVLSLSAEITQLEKEENQLISRVAKRGGEIASMNENIS